MSDLDEKIAEIRAGLHAALPLNNPARIAHFARCDPYTIKSILDRLDAVTRERDEARVRIAALEEALRPVRTRRARPSRAIARMRWTGRRARAKRRELVNFLPMERP